MRFSRFLARFATAAAAALAASAVTTARAQVVISSVYTNGGKAGATYTSDYVELLNNSASSVSLAGYGIENNNQVAGTSANNFGTTTPVALNSVTLLPGQFYLIGLVGDANVGSALPTPNQTIGSNLNASSFELILYSSITGLTVADQVAEGTGNSGEGTILTASTAPTSAFFRSSLSNTTAPFVKDTNSNSSDYVVSAFTGTFGQAGYVGPRNSTIILGASAPEPSAAVLLVVAGVPVSVSMLRRRKA